MSKYRQMEDPKLDLLVAEMIADKNMFTKRNYFGPVDIQKLHIQILDEFGRILNLNTMDFGLALNLTCLYDY